MKRKLVFVTMAVVCVFLAGCTSRKTVTLGSLDDPLAVTVTELFAQLLESNGYRVKREYRLESGALYHALLSGGIDLYAEYSSQALVNILQKEPVVDQEGAVEALKKPFAEKGIVTLESLPQNNSLAIVTLTETAEKYDLKTYSDVIGKAGELRLAYEGNKLTDPAAVPRLEAAYGGFSFQELIQTNSEMELHMGFHEKKWELIITNADNGQLTGTDHKVLRDNFHAFLPRSLVPLTTKEFASSNGELIALINRVAVSINDKAARELMKKTVLDGVPYPSAAKIYLKGKEFLR